MANPKYEADFEFRPSCEILIWSSRILIPDFSVKLGLRFAIAMEKRVVVGNRFFNELLQQENFGRADDGVDALLKRLHRREGLERRPEQHHASMPALVHGHL